MTESDTLANQWRSISALLDEALLLPVTEHPRWLADLPASVAHLRETLQHFLELHAEVDGRDFLEQPAAPVVDVETPAPLLQPGEIVGPYRAIEELGSGGMGSVWLAERADGKPRRRVALKLPRMVWASDLPERLERERDILAPLEHPNIARLYDAGVDEKGRPFLAIEYVEGVRITEYCKTQKLDVTRRVKLFLQVLSAVQYAHTRLVLHRDLKPANILVNRNGDVRLLDFGIAKLVDEVTATSDLIVATASRALTPRYASPEQLRDERLSLISDVYSLGVILHELLTGESPYPVSAKSRAQIELAVLEGVIALPSRRLLSRGNDTTLDLDPIASSKALRGDLDAVILKALALDPSARYPSVEALRADLDRWLSGRPVLAMPPSLLAAAKKFVLRNRTAVVVSTTAIAAVVLMTVIALYQADKAIAESQRAAATRDFLIHMFESANPELNGGREATVRELVLSATDELSRTATTDPNLLSDVYTSIARVWLNYGDIERAVDAMNKRRAVSKDLGLARFQLSSEIGAANLAAHRFDAYGLKRIISELSESSGYRQRDIYLSADIEWLTGWLALSEGNHHDANALFASSAALAESANDYSRVARSYYGQAIVSAYQGETDHVREIVERGLDMVRVSRLNDAKKLHRRLELITSLAVVGDYQYGWDLMEKLFLDSRYFFHGFMPPQLDAYAFYIVWSIKVGKIDAGKVAADAVKINDIPDSLRKANLALSIALLRLTEKNFEAAKKGAVTALETFRIKAPSQSYKALAVLAELAVHDADLIGLRTVLEQPEWREGNTGALDLNCSLLFHWFWGVESYMSGDFKTAVAHFNEARKLVPKVGSENHPRRFLIDLARIKAELRVIPESEFSARKNEITEIKNRLIRSYGESGYPVKITEDLAATASEIGQDRAQNLVPEWDISLM